MKSIATLALSFFIFYQTHAQWVELEPVTQGTLSSVSFLNDDTGLVCGANQIWKTTNGGQLWTTVFSGAPEIFLEEIFWIKENTALAVGYNFGNNQAVILRSVNAGAGWAPVSSPVNVNLKDIHFINETTGYVCGQGAVLRTTNGGQSWTNVSNGTAGGQSIFFLNENTGFVAGGSPVNASLERTTNGGNSWTQIDVNTDNFLQAIYFPSASVGYTVGWNGGILKSKDGGLTWTQQAGVNMNGNLDVFFFDNDWGYIAGGSQMLASIQKTVNGGETWEEEAPSVPQGLTSIDFTANKIGYTVGAGGTILKNSTISTTTFQLPGKDWVKIYPNPSNSQVWIETPGQLITRIKIFDQDGSLTSDQDFSTEKARIDLSGLPSANYYLAVSSGASTLIRKIVKF